MLENEAQVFLIQLLFSSPEIYNFKHTLSMLLSNICKYINLGNQSMIKSITSSFPIFQSFPWDHVPSILKIVVFNHGGASGYIFYNEIDYQSQYIEKMTHQPIITGHTFLYNAWLCH